MATLAMTYSAVAEDLGKTLTSSVDVGLHVRGDRELLTQLFVNLIENALRHTPEGATVGMSLRKNEHGLIADVFEARDTRNGARQRIQALLPPGKQPKHTGQRAWACASSHRRRSPQRTNHARRQLSRAQGHAAI